MGSSTSIEWTDHTFNPWIGCTKISPGCKNCYAAKADDRHLLGPVSHWGPGAPRHVTSAANWREPITWANAARKAGHRAKVFCASQADIFESEAPVAQRRLLWELIGETHDALDWQILTKRPERIAEVMSDDQLNYGFFELTLCWLGTSTENQETAENRIPALLGVDAKVRFISAEPLLGPLNLDGCIVETQEYEFSTEVWRKSALDDSDIWHSDDGDVSDGPQYPKLDWVICGGESGHGARQMNPLWARSLRDQCAAAEVPFFMKQMGSVFGPHKGHDLPDDLNIKQFPHERIENATD
jgi:protein gp37